MISTKNDRHCWYLTSGNESSFNKTNLDLHWNCMSILKRHDVIPFYIPSDRFFFWNPFLKLFVKHPFPPIRSKPDPKEAVAHGVVPSLKDAVSAFQQVPTKPPTRWWKKRPETKSAGFWYRDFCLFFSYGNFYIPVRLEIVACKGKKTTAVFFELYRSDIVMM